MRVCGSLDARVPYGYVSRFSDVWAKSGPRRRIQDRRYFGRALRDCHPTPSAMAAPHRLKAGGGANHPLRRPYAISQTYVFL